jgi:hypothetical protein
MARQVPFVPHQVHQVGRVLAIVDRELGPQADARRVLAQQARADRMEGARPQQRRRRPHRPRTGRLADDAFYPARHLHRGTAREGEQQHLARIGAAGEQRRHAVRQRAGLAGACAGDHQQRSRQFFAGPVLGRRALLRIEPVEESQVGRGIEPLGDGVHRLPGIGRTRSAAIGRQVGRHRRQPGRPAGAEGLGVEVHGAAAAAAEQIGLPQHAARHPHDDLLELRRAARSAGEAARHTG